MTATPSITPKKTATTILLAGIGIVAFAYVLHLVQQPVAGAGWRQETSAAVPAALTAPVQTRGSNSDGAAPTGAAGTSAARGRN
jgi:hypothetical protein